MRTDLPVPALDISQIGPNTQPLDRFRSCQLNINLTYPVGLTFSIIDVNHRGSVSIDEGIYADLKSTVYFSGPTAWKQVILISDSFWVLSILTLTQIRAP
jgi:hypothetical protein